MDKDARISKEALEAWGVRFPSEHEIAKIEAEKRALLRDQFAMAALQGMCARDDPERDIRKRVEVAYAYADSMLQERAK